MRTVTGKIDILNQCSDLLIDESQMSGGIPSSVFFPENQKDLRSIILRAADEQQQITFIGGHTGTTGGATPVDNCWAVSFARMKRIQKVIRDSAGIPILVCEPGITLAEIEGFLKNPDLWPYTVPGCELFCDQSYCYLPDPTEMTAQLGGTVATNASGARSFRFGSTRDFVQLLSMITPSGDTFTVERGTSVIPSKGILIKTDQNKVISLDPFTFESLQLKNASGFFSKSPMDLIDLFIGSEGTLVAFSSIGIKLHKKMTYVSGCTFFSSQETTFSFADFLREDPQVVSIELFDHSALQFIEKYRERFPESIPAFPPNTSHAIFWEFIERKPTSFESRFALWEVELHRCKSSFDNTWSGIEPREIDRLKRFRHALPEMVNATVVAYKKQCNSIRKIGTDTALPEKNFTAVYNEYISLISNKKLTFAAFGHLGNFHIHINLLPSNEQELQDSLDVYDKMMTLTVANQGTISAEHGIGKIKKKYLERMYGTEVIMQMKKIKSAFDPQWRFNPGTLFSI